MSELTETDFTSMKVTDLKKELKSRGLSVSGNKNELIERLQLAVMKTDEDILNETDDLLNNSDTKLEKSKEEQKAKTTPKKVAIKRDINIVASGTPEKENVEGPTAKKVTKKTEVTTKTEEAPKPEEGTKDQEEEVKEETVKAKITEMTDADKAKARAERFGISQEAQEAKKQARAARFGIQSKAASKLGDAPVADLDTLKKRAERFGISSSNTLKNLELQEKIKKRQERFGSVETTDKETKVVVNSGVNSVVQNEQMKKRAERFGLPTK